MPDQSHTMVAILMLAFCWVFEAVAPMAHASRVGGSRLRHLVLGGVNALPALATTALVAFVDARADALGFGLLQRTGLPPWAIVLVAFVILDFAQYACHVAMHKLPLLWRLHAVHHHADHVEATTAFRFHTLEIVAHGLLLVPLVFVIGIGLTEIALYNAVLLPTSMFHHANIRLAPSLERSLGWLIVTPGLHRLHHARWQPLTDSNYAAVFSFWDRLFGTFSRRDRPQAIPVGLDGFEPEHTDTLTGMLKTPFSDARAELGVTPESEHETSAT